MLEGFRFGAPGSPSPLKRAKLASTEEARVAKTNLPAEDSWHVSDSVEADDADADDADAVTSTGVVRGERRGRVGETNEGDASGSTDGRGEAHAEVVDGVVEQPSSAEHAASVSPRRETDRRRRWTYGDAVDADAACAARDPKNPNRFFLPRGHPGRPNPPPADWRARLDALRRDADSRAAPVDLFHAFLLSLRDRQEPHFQALVACLLSVQCRDAVALAAAENLRNALGGDITLGAVHAATAEAVAEAIKTLNFKNAKARYVKRCAAVILSSFGGKTPRSVCDLERLPGVGPKLARLVASVAFGDKGAGLVVDAHVRRVAGRLGWTDAAERRSAEKTRARLETFLPRDEWESTTLALISHGQRTCVSVNPKCHECPVASRCPSREPGDFFADGFKKKTEKRLRTWKTCENVSERRRERSFVCVRRNARRGQVSVRASHES